MTTELQYGAAVEIKLGGLAGAWITVILVALVLVPAPVVTCIKPVVPFPSVTVIVVAVLSVIVAAVPPTVTAVAKFRLVPVMTIELPAQASDGKLVIVGGSGEATLTV